MNQKASPMSELDRYLDGMMSDAEASAFRERLAGDASLRAAVEGQSAIDAALGRGASPDASHVAACLAACEEDDASGDGPLSFDADAGKRAGRPWWVRVGALAALIALAGAVVWVALFGYPSQQPAGYADPQTVVIAQTYELALADGFEPEWVCETDEEFRETYRDRIGQAVSLAQLPSDRVALGLSYQARARDSTVVLLAEAEGRPIMVFVDQSHMLRYYDLAVPDGLYLHRREAERLVFLELSPLPESKVVDYLEPVKRRPMD